MTCSRKCYREDLKVVSREETHTHTVRFNQLLGLQWLLSKLLFICLNSECKQRWDRSYKQAEGLLYPKISQPIFIIIAYS